MKKTLIVSAVAMAISGNAIAAEMYGNIRLGLRTSEYAGPDELDVISGKLVLGSKGSSDLGNGLTASYGIELEHDNADTKQPGSIAVGPNTVVTGNGWANDKSWVALEGGFGKFIAGRFGDLSGYACGGTDLLTHGSAEACDSVFNTEPDDAIQYRGSAGAFEFGVIYVADGTGENPTHVGGKFSADNWSVGATFVSAGDLVAYGGVPAGESGSVIGGTFQLGDIGLGVSVADNGANTDESAVDFGLYMPLGPGNLAVVISDIDLNDNDSADFDYNVSMGGGAYWGVEFNSLDSAAEDRVTGYLGMTF